MTMTIGDEEPQSMPDLLEALRKLAGESEHLPAERRLSERLGVNRYMIRRALRILRDAGELADARPRNNYGRGWRYDQIVRNTSPAELWEVRLTFEPQIARLAAIQATPAELQRIADIHARSEPDVFDRENDIAFHCGIATASHNTLAVFILELLTDLTRDKTFQMKFPPFTDETGYGHHEEILTAITERKVAAAEAAMRRHLMAIHLWSAGFSGKHFQ